MGEIQKVYTQKEVDDLLQEEREKVVEEKREAFWKWFFGDENIMVEDVIARELGGDYNEMMEKYEKKGEKK